MMFATKAALIQAARLPVGGTDYPIDQALKSHPPSPETEGGRTGSKYSNSPGSLCVCVRERRVDMRSGWGLAGIDFGTSSILKKKNENYSALSNRGRI